MQRKILITGGSGFIGSALIKLILKQTYYTVINYDKLTYAANPGALSEIENDPRYLFIHADICDQDQVSKIINDYKPDSIIHLAAESHVDNSINSSEEFISTNIVGTHILLKAFQSHWNLHNKPEHFRFIHVSTDEVYGDLTEDEPKFSIDSPYKPSSPYSASKAASDHLAYSWHRTYNLPVIITHCTNNYGAFQHNEKFIPKIIINALHDLDIPIYGDGLNIRDWLYVEDHAEALLLILNKGLAGEVYNIGGNNEIKNIDLANTICSILDQLRPNANGKLHASNIKMVEDRLGHDRRYGLDINHMYGQLGWKPRTSFEDGIRATIKWYVKNYG